MTSLVSYFTYSMKKNDTHTQKIEKERNFTIHVIRPIFKSKNEKRKKGKKKLLKKNIKIKLQINIPHKYRHKNL